MAIVNVLSMHSEQQEITDTIEPMYNPSLSNLQSPRLRQHPFALRFLQKADTALPEAGMSLEE